MGNWLLFRDARFKVLLRYPDVTPKGHAVQKKESLVGDVARVHFTSTEGGEVYFEITNYAALPAHEEYEQHRLHLEKRLDEFSITELKAIRWKSLIAYQYSFVWNQGARSVMVFERQDGTYRILYDPRSPLSEQILSTLEWID